MSDTTPTLSVALEAGGNDWVVSVVIASESFLLHCYASEDAARARMPALLHPRYAPEDLPRLPRRVALRLLARLPQDELMRQGVATLLFVRALYPLAIATLDHCDIVEGWASAIRKELDPAWTYSQAPRQARPTLRPSRLHPRRPQNTRKAPSVAQDRAEEVVEP